MRPNSFRQAGQVYQESEQIVRYVNWCAKPSVQLSEFDYERLGQLQFNPIVRAHYDWLEQIEKLLGKRRSAGVMLTGAATELTYNLGSKYGRGQPA